MMEQAAFIFVGSILLSLTVIVLAGCLLIINNLFYRYWKPFTIYTEIQSHHTQEPTFKKDTK